MQLKFIKGETLLKVQPQEQLSLRKKKKERRYG